MRAELVDISVLSKEDKARVHRMIGLTLLSDTRVLTMRQAAEVYGYQYNTIRILVCTGKIASIGSGHTRRITHSAMRNFIAHKKKEGRHRIAERVPFIKQSDHAQV